MWSYWKLHTIITGENRDTLNRTLNDMSTIDLPILCFGDAQAKSSRFSQSWLVFIYFHLSEQNHIIRYGFVNLYIFWLKTDKAHCFKTWSIFCFTRSIKVITFLQPIINIFIIFFKKMVWKWGWRKQF